MRAQGSALAIDMLQSTGRPEDLILAGRALAASDQPREALVLIDRLSRAPRPGEAQRAAIALLDEVRPGVDEEEWKSIRQRLERARR